MPNVAKFHVHEDAWGYRVWPAVEQPFYVGKGAPGIDVKNHVNARIEVELPAGINTVTAPPFTAGPGGTVSIVLQTPAPTQEFEVYIWVTTDECPVFRARAESDPRVRPK